MLFACAPLDETISDHFALAGTPIDSCSSKPWFAVLEIQHAGLWMSMGTCTGFVLYPPLAYGARVYMPFPKEASLSRFALSPTELRASLSIELSPRLRQLDGNPLALHFLSWNWCSQCWSYKLKVWSMIISGDIINSWIDLNSDLRAGTLKDKYSWFQECSVAVPEMKPKARNIKISHTK